ncbi:MAG: hypothetical protein J6J45_05860 [Clostridia bacterium]|nr:hypothetical protein [Clostridia bacterium]
MKKRLEWLVPFALAAAAIILELFLSNFVYFAFVAGRTETVDYKKSDFAYDVTGDKTQFGLGDLGFELNSVSFNVKAKDETVEPFELRVSVYVIDERNSDYSLAVARTIPVTAKEQKITFFCNSGGKAEDLIFITGEAQSDVLISNVILNPQYKPDFNQARFLLILAVMLIGFLLHVRSSENKLVPYKNRHRRSVALSVTLSVAGSVAVAILSASSETLDPIAYPLRQDVRLYDPYIQQFDAFMKGQLHLDVKPDERLALLKNPYDLAERTFHGIDYMWDRAYFDGKYFSYFGVTPLLLVYFPYYFLTGSLPNAGLVMAVFCVMTAVFFALAVEEYAKISGKKHFGYFTAFCTVSGFLASFALIIARGQQRFYYIAGMAGMAFSAAFIMFMLKAVGSQRIKRIIYFALAGISFGLGFHSRVNSVVPLAIVAVAFVLLWAIKRFKEKQVGTLFAEMAALGTPVVIAVVASMLYNKARFGSFFDFGTAYQLTISDTSFYSIGLHGIMPAFFHYFLQGFHFVQEFPYVGMNYIAPPDYGRYFYVDSGIGIFAMPFMLSLLLFPIVLKKKTIGKNRKIIFAAALIAIPVTAFINCCLGGIIFRYTSDISVVAAFLAAVIMLETAETALQKFGKDGYAVFKKAAYCLGGANAATAMGAMLAESGNFVSASPVVFEYIRDIFVFWN